MAWERLKDSSSGRSYYYNNETELTQWEFPDDILLQTLQKHGWDRAESDGNVYFYTVDGSTSSWNLPEQVLIELKSIFGDDLSEAEIKGESSVNGEEEIAESESETQNQQEQEHEPQQQSPASVNPEKDHDSNSEKKVVPKTNELLGIEYSGIEEGGSTAVDVSMASDSPPKDQVENDFIGLLESLDIPTNSTFNQCIPTLVNHANYWEVTDPLLRKELFTQFITQKRALELQNSKDKIRPLFMEVMAKNNVKYYTRWETFEKLIMDDDLCNTISDDVKREFFDEYVSKLRSEKEYQIAKTKQNELVELEKELRATVELNTEFTKTAVQLQSKYKNVTKSEILDVFEKVMSDKEKEQELMLSIEKKKNYRTDRKARQGFIRLLEKLLESGEFKPSSQLRWYQFVSVFKDKPEFLELCGHRGSTAIDYYWDIVEKENLKLQDKVELFKQQLVNANKKLGDVDEKMFIDIMLRASKAEVCNTPQEDMLSIYRLIKSPEAQTTQKRGTHQTDFPEGRLGVSKDGPQKRQKITLRRG